MIKVNCDEKITSRFIRWNVYRQSQFFSSDKTCKQPQWILSEKEGCLSETPVVCLFYNDFHVCAVLIA